MSKKELNQYEIDTSAFWPCRGKAAEYYRNSWQRYVVECTRDQWERFLKRAGRNYEDPASFLTPLGVSRRADREFIRKYAIGIR